MGRADLVNGGSRSGGDPAFVWCLKNVNCLGGFGVNSLGELRYKLAHAPFSVPVETRQSKGIPRKTTSLASHPSLSPNLSSLPST